mgnify:CR=1 FL=1
MILYSAIIFFYTSLCDCPVEIVIRVAECASGLKITCALVKGGLLFAVSVKTVTRKATEKSFAAGCNRNRIALIAPLMEITAFWEYALTGMIEIRAELDLE